MEDNAKYYWQIKKLKAGIGLSSFTKGEKNGK